MQTCKDIADCCKTLVIVMPGRNAEGVGLCCMPTLACLLKCNFLIFLPDAEAKWQMLSINVCILLQAQMHFLVSPVSGWSFWAGLCRRRSLPQDALKHIDFTCLGLGDSNYTRYMGVPRAFKVPQILNC